MRYYTIHRKFVHSEKLDIGVVFVFVIMRVAKRSRRIHDFTGILDPATPRRMTITTCRYTSARTNETSIIGITSFLSFAINKLRKHRKLFEYPLTQYLLLLIMRERSIRIE